MASGMVRTEGLLMMTDSVTEDTESLDAVADVVSEADLSAYGVFPCPRGPHQVPVRKRIDRGVQPEVLPAGQTSGSS
ncbi:hypothetical protein DXT66_30265 (plasmid) [Nocardia farcinica]|nr:hypothetical protein DXT66_30265 [Nocardia farcinica]